MVALGNPGGLLGTLRSSEYRRELPDSLGLQQDMQANHALLH